MQKNTITGLVVGCCLLVLVAVVIGAIAPNNSGTNSDIGWGTNDTSNSTQNPIKPSGEYKIGTDIPAGEYYLVNNGGNMYVELASDSSGELESIISNLNTEGNTYITTKEGEYLKVDNGNIYEVNNTTHTQPTDGYYPEGMYKVGTDIPAGEYTLEATSDNGYVEVTKNSRHTLGSIVTNDNFENNKIIDVSNGEYVLISGAKMKSK